MGHGSCPDRWARQRVRRKRAPPHSTTGGRGRRRPQQRSTPHNTRRMAARYLGRSIPSTAANDPASNPCTQVAADTAANTPTTPSCEPLFLGSSLSFVSCFLRGPEGTHLLNMIGDSLGLLFSKFALFKRIWSIFDKWKFLWALNPVIGFALWHFCCPLL